MLYGDLLVQLDKSSKVDMESYVEAAGNYTVSSDRPNDEIHKLLDNGRDMLMMKTKRRTKR